MLKQLMAVLAGDYGAAAVWAAFVHGAAAVRAAFVHWPAAVGAVLFAWTAAMGAPAPTRNHLKFNHTGIVRILNSIPQMNFAPLNYAKDGEPARGSAVVPANLAAAFDSINLAAFKKNLFSLAPCDNCYAAMGVTSFDVYVQPGFITRVEALAGSDENSRALVTFILSHEISHYLYEMAVRADARHLSPSHHFSYADLQLKEKDPSPTELAAAHAEIDTFAMHLMSRMGFQDPAAAALSFHRLVQEKDILSEPDFDQRVQAAHEFQGLYAPRQEFAEGELISGSNFR